MSFATNPYGKCEYIFLSDGRNSLYSWNLVSPSLTFEGISLNGTIEVMKELVVLGPRINGN